MTCCQQTEGTNAVNIFRAALNRNVHSYINLNHSYISCWRGYIPYNDVVISINLLGLNCNKCSSCSFFFIGQNTKKHIEYWLKLQAPWWTEMPDLVCHMINRCRVSEKWWLMASCVWLNSRLWKFFFTVLKRRSNITEGVCTTAGHFLFFIFFADDDKASRKSRNQKK